MASGSCPENLFVRIPEAAWARPRIFGMEPIPVMVVGCVITVALILRTWPVVVSVALVATVLIALFRLAFVNDEVYFAHYIAFFMTFSRNGLYRGRAFVSSAGRKIQQ